MRRCWDFTDVTLADEDTNSILADICQGVNSRQWGNASDVDLGKCRHLVQLFAALFNFEISARFIPFQLFPLFNSSQFAEMSHSTSNFRTSKNPRPSHPLRIREQVKWLAVKSTYFMWPWWKRLQTSIQATRSSSLRGVPFASSDLQQVKSLEFKSTYFMWPWRTKMTNNFEISARFIPFQLGLWRLKGCIAGKG